MVTNKKTAPSRRIEYRGLKSCLRVVCGKKRGSKGKKDEIVDQFHRIVESIYRDLESKPGSVKLYKLATFKARITDTIHYYHLAVYTVVMIFGEYMGCLDDEVIHTWTREIFGHCVRKNDLLEALYEIHRYFDSYDTGTERHDFITRLIAEKGQLTDTLIIIK